MRKFIIKYWFGPYNTKWKLFNNRAAVSNYNLVAIAILVKLFISNPTIAIPLMILPLSMVYFTTFWYLSKYPVKWDELEDDLQKHYYGWYWTTKFPSSQWPDDFRKNYNEWKEFYEDIN